MLIASPCRVHVSTLLEAKRRSAGAALKATNEDTADETNDRANAVARAIDRVMRQRWGVFIRTKKLDASILTAGLRKELESEIEKALRDQADATTKDTMASIQKSVPGEALLVIHRKTKLLELDESELTEGAGEFAARFVAAASAAAKKAASAFLKLPNAAEVTKLIFEPFKGQSWLDRLKNWLPVEKDIAKEIANGLSLGKSRQQIAKAILPLVDGTRSAAIRIARTEVHRVNVTAQLRSVDQALGPSVEGWVFTATPGERTCPICSGFDGKVYKRGETKPRLPLHPNCRCTLRPLMRSWDSFGLPPEVAAILKQPFGGRAKGM